MLKVHDTYNLLFYKYKYFQRNKKNCAALYNFEHQTEVEVVGLNSKSLKVITLLYAFEILAYI